MPVVITYRLHVPLGSLPPNCESKLAEPDGPGDRYPPDGAGLGNVPEGTAAYAVGLKVPETRGEPRGMKVAAESDNKRFTSDAAPDPTPVIRTRLAPEGATSMRSRSWGFA
jgi:hypothetical protein